MVMFQNLVRQCSSFMDCYCHFSKILNIALDKANSSRLLFSSRTPTWQEIRAIRISAAGLGVSFSVQTAGIYQWQQSQAQQTEVTAWVKSTEKVEGWHGRHRLWMWVCGVSGKEGAFVLVCVADAEDADVSRSTALSLWTHRHSNSVDAPDL